jgi:hypothetical protein
MKYWLACERFVVQVNTDDAGNIVWTAPIVRKFVGQPLTNLLRWIGVRYRLEVL